MADRVEVGDITIPAGTPATAPVQVDVSFPPGVARHVTIVIPDGHVGLTGLRLGQADQAVIPRNPTGWITGNNEIISWTLDSYLNTGSWQLIGYNTDVYQHAFHVRWAVDETKTPPGPPVTPVVITPTPPPVPVGGPLSEPGAEFSPVPLLPPGTAPEGLPAPPVGVPGVGA